jgi:fucose permease
MKEQISAHDRVALTLARGAVAVVMTIAIGAFGRSFYLAIVTEGHQNIPISDAATQLLTALGSALVGGAVGFIGGSQQNRQLEVVYADKDKKDTK